ncbi:hypothetical protein M5689_000411 [Euphorbia peplus]|nr:hypothetical protein M5689_000411 [Euphorbia peplus]
MRSKANKIAKLTKASIKILCKARDVYVKGLLGFSGVGNGSTGIGGGIARLPKSFSVNSSMEVDEEELRRLLRLKSQKESETRSFTRKDVELYSTDCNGMKRSYSVGLGKIGKIEEDRACSFREDVIDVNNLYPRSKSHAFRRNA